MRETDLRAALQHCARLWADGDSTVRLYNYGYGYVFAYDAEPEPPEIDQEEFEFELRRTLEASFSDEERDPNPEAFGVYIDPADMELANRVIAAHCSTGVSMWWLHDCETWYEVKVVAERATEWLCNTPIGEHVVPHYELWNVKPGKWLLRRIPAWLAKHARSEWYDVVEAIATYWDRMMVPTSDKLNGVAYGILNFLDNKVVAVDYTYQLYMGWEGRIDGDLRKRYCSVFASEPADPTDHIVWQVQQLVVEYTQQCADTRAMAAGVVSLFFGKCYIEVDGIVLDIEYRSSGLPLKWSTR